MIVLVLNCGSSSVKFELIETDADRIEAGDDRLLASGMVEKIGTDEATLHLQAGDQHTQEVVTDVIDHYTAISRALKEIEHSGVIQRRGQIEAIGHRVVHGGEFSSSQRVTDEVVAQMEAAVELAPLHNPHNIRGYRVCRRLFPDLPQVAVFDTAFHQSMPPRAYIYALPKQLARKLRIRRYGFHGTSHRYVAYRYRKISGRAREDVSLITAHLGNGCSMCAIQGGRSVDTSMGFTPLEGLVMGTRTGDLDPSILLHLMGKEEMTVGETAALLNRHSGLLGISGESNDMRELLEASAKGHEGAFRAIEVFCYRVRKYIGAYTAVLGHVDALIFAGGIGENAPRVRELSCERLEDMGYEIDPEKNAAATGGKELDISTKRSRTRVWVIPTNEELLIARDTYRVVAGIPHPH